jgi:predicted aconitase
MPSCLAQMSASSRHSAGLSYAICAWTRVESPHASADECRALAAAFGDAKAREGIDVIVTAGRVVVAEIRRDGTGIPLARLSEVAARKRMRLTRAKLPPF